MPLVQLAVPRPVVTWAATEVVKMELEGLEVGLEAAVLKRMELVGRLVVGRLVVVQVVEWTAKRAAHVLVAAPSRTEDHMDC